MLYRALEMAPGDDSSRYHVVYDLHIILGAPPAVDKVQCTPLYIGHTPIFWHGIAGLVPGILLVHF